MDKKDNIRCRRRRSFKKRFSLCALSLLLAVSVLFLACCGGVTPPPSADEKQALIDRIETVNVEACGSMAECFGRWKLPKGYDVSKLTSAESVIYQHYYKPIVPAEAARTAVDCFLNLYYDKISFSDKTAYTDALLRCMVLALGDDYAVYRTAAEYAGYTNSMSGTYGGIGMTVRKDYTSGEVEVIRLIAGAPAERAGVMLGDLLYSVEGILVTKETIDFAFEKMQGEVGAAVRFEIKRGDRIISFEIVRENLDNITVSYKMLEGNIAYIAVTAFKGTTAKYFKEYIDKAEAAGAVGFIFDMRDNPGGYLVSVQDVLDHLAPKGSTLFSYGTQKNPPDEYFSTSEHSISLPSVVLCNAATASAGELFTAAMRDYNSAGILKATVVGTDAATFGKGIMQASFPLKDNSVITMTTALYNPPCGVNYHGVGVIPDVTCEESEAMDTAVAELLKLIQK